MSQAAETTHSPDADAGAGTSAPDPALATRLTRAAGIEVPLLCGAMYPCSNPELVAAVSEAGGMGIIQPISQTYVHGHKPFRDGLRHLKTLTTKPVGMNVIVERSSKVYQERMERWMDDALEEGVRFFVTSLGDPRWVVERAHAVGGVVYHDVTERRFAEKGLDSGADGLIAVNRRAGGHAGGKGAAELLDELGDLGVPVVGAGGVGDADAFVDLLALGYEGAQLGTRFIATEECHAHADYKRAVVEADEDDIVLTERITGVPVAVIETDYVRSVGTKAGPLGRWLLSNRHTKHWMRTLYSLRSIFQLKKASLEGGSYKDYWQAGQSVAGVHAIEPAGAIVERFADAVRDAGGVEALRRRPASGGRLTGDTSGAVRCRRR